MVSIKKKIKNVFKKEKKTDAAATEAAAPVPPTDDPLMEARQLDEANVCMPKDDIREEEGMMGIVEDVTDMEEYLSVVEEATSKENEEQEEEEEQDEEATQEAETEEIVAPSTPAEVKVVEEEEPVKVSSPFMCGITNCLGRD